MIRADWCPLGFAVSKSGLQAELDRLTREEAVRGGGYPSPLNYMRFPKSICIPDLGLILTISRDLGTASDDQAAISTR